MSPNSPAPKTPLDENTKIAEVKAQLAVLEVSLLAHKERLQREQEEQDRDWQEAQVCCEEVDCVELEWRVEAGIMEQWEKAMPRLDMEPARMGRPCEV